MSKQYIYKLLNINIIMFLTLLTVFIFNSSAQAQCGIALKEVVVQEIGDATYLKDFRIRFEEGNPKNPQTKEFAILLNKGTHYRFNIQANEDCEDQPILKLFDFIRPYGSNYDPDDETSYEAFEFFCSKTQVYYISMSFSEAKKGCAVTVVSFIKNY